MVGGVFRMHVHRRVLAMSCLLAIGSSTMAETVRVRRGLPDVRTVIAEDAQGRVVFGLGGHQGSLLIWDRGRLLQVDRGEVGGVAVARDGGIWYTIEDRIKVLPSAASATATDHTERFGGKTSGIRRLFVGRLGDLWIEGCPKLRAPDGEFCAVPCCPVPGPCPAPSGEDPFGNVWGLVRQDGSPDKTRVVALLAPHRKAWTVLAGKADLHPARWETLAMDGLGFVWAAGGSELVRFDPRRPQAGWVSFPKKDLPKVDVTALGLAPSGRALAGFADGSVFELDMYVDGTGVARRVAVEGLPAAPVRAVHTDRDGAIWVVAGGDVLRTPSTSRWRRLASLPVGNHDFYGVLLDGTLYVSGGITHYGYPVKMAALDSLWAYDAKKNQWDVLPPMSVKRGYCGIAALAGEIWVLGGYTYTAATGDRRQTLRLVEVFNPSTRQWRRGPALEVPRAELVALTAGGRLYVIGGADEKREFASMLSIAPGETTWRSEPDAPRTFRQASGCVLDGKIYVGRGRSDAFPNAPGLYVYDPERRGWDTSVPPMPIGPPNAPLTAVHDGEIWVMGGWGTKHGRAIHRYAPQTRTWTRGPDLPIPLGWGAAVEMDGKLVIAGGAYYAREHHGFIFSDCAFLLRDEGVPSMYQIKPPGVGTLDMTTRIDLKRSLELAGQNMLNILRPDFGYLPHWSCFAAVWPYIPHTKFTSRWPGHNLGRWWDAMLRLENATGFRIPPHIEAAMLANLQRFFDNPDNLCLAPGDMDGVKPEFDLHSLREGLLALNGLVRHRDSDWARAKGHAMIGSLLRLMNEDGTWTVEGFDYCRRLGVKADVATSHREHTNSHGRLIEALVWFYQATGDPSALTLADRAARYHLKHTTHPDGSFNGASKAWHSHSYFGTLRGLLLYGELTGRREYIDAVAATFRKTVRDGFVKRSGFSPHDIGGRTGETASTGDAAQIALWLGTRHGYGEFLDDAARLLRCRIVPSQLTNCPVLRAKAPPAEHAHEDRYRNVERRIIGAYGGCHRHPHAGKSCVTDVTSAVLHTVVDFYNHIASRTENGIKVHFHLDLDDELLRMTSTRRRSAKVTIVPKVTDNVLIRIPRWTPRVSVRITVDGRPIKLSIVDDYARVPRSVLPGQIVLTYDLPVSTHTEKTADVTYEFLWRGDEIIGVYPNTDYFPFYPTYVSAKTSALLAFKAKRNLASDARGAKARASSHLAASNDVGHPDHAIDADEHNLWISNEPVTEGRPQWLQVDLGKVFGIRAVVIDHRFDLVTPTRYHIETSLDGERFGALVPVKTCAKNRRIVFEFADKTRARYVRYVCEEVRRRHAMVGHIEVYDRSMPR